MEYRQLGNSDVKVTAVTLGTWAIGGWMWGGQDESDALDAIRRSVDLGVTSIDTAAVYGFGSSEELVGKAIAGRRDQVQILTKYGLRWDIDGNGEEHFDTVDSEGNPVTIYKHAKADSVIEECERSLKQLGVETIDLYQCHWRDRTTPVEETLAAVDKLLKDGKIRAAGVSNFAPDEILAANQVVPLASDQPPFSMVNRSAEKDVIPTCRENGIGVIVYSPLERGLLTGKVTMDREFPETDHRSRNPFFAKENRRRVLDFLDKLRPVADGHDATLAQLVICWTIHRPGITAALVGARNVQQAEQNAAAADLELSDEEMRRIDELVEGLELDV
jgi:aryl-alcohol dehydrogenase-like predicted oxidoreductase